MPASLIGNEVHSTDSHSCCTIDVEIASRRGHFILPSMRTNTAPPRARRTATAPINPNPALAGVDAELVVERGRSGGGEVAMGGSSKGDHGD